tara:strand:+ start:311 stop:1312 length:1002 start_codon:yes stop_codon:yes gene_type:complete
MGVKLVDLVDKKNIKWEQLEGKKLAIDASNVIFQFLSSIRQRDGTPLMDNEGNVTSHLVGLFSRVPNLMQKGITPIFVFDGKAPALKEKIRVIRRANKAKAREKYEKAALEDDQDSMGKYSRQLTRLNSEMVQECKELLTALGLPIVQAPSEAEAQCAYMNKKKKVWATGSQDYDSLLFGSPRLIQNLTLSQKRKLPGGKFVYISPHMIELKDVLDRLELNQEELLVLGILVGTDYNPGGVKGIGPKKALKLIQSGKKFETIFNDLETNFDWEEILNTFKHIPVEDVTLKESKINLEKVKELLIEKHDFGEERVNNTLSKLTSKQDESIKKWF